MFPGVGVIVEEGTAGRYHRSKLLGIKATGTEAGGLWALCNVYIVASTDISSSSSSSCRWAQSEGTATAHRARGVAG